jgi:hypothetical protein
LTPEEAFEFTKQARNLPEKEFLEKKDLHKKAIDILEYCLDNTIESKKQLWTTKAEYLVFRAKYVTENETLEDSHRRSLDAMRWMFKCMQLHPTYKEFFTPKFEIMMEQHIRVFGCIIPENKSHFLVSCPIWLKSTELGKKGLSMGGHYKKAICSICKLSMLDEKCIHQSGKDYDGKICEIIKTDFEFLHIALVDSPKDPENSIAEVSYPKEDLYSRLPEEQKNKVKENTLHLYCNSCKEGNFDSSKITPEKFFEMQKLSINIE